MMVFNECSHKWLTWNVKLYFERKNWQKYILRMSAATVVLEVLRFKHPAWKMGKIRNLKLVPADCLSFQDPVVQNLTKLLPNVTLKFLSWNKANTLIFFPEKMKSISHFCRKNINVSENTLAATFNEFVLNELVKLTILWTTGPRVLKVKMLSTGD